MVWQSGRDLRVSFLKQEFTDELVPTRSLRDEFRSVFREALDALQALSDAEVQLASLGGNDGNDGGGGGGGEAMQTVLDDMAALQERATRLEAYSIDGKVGPRPAPPPWGGIVRCHTA